jgi:hypothetical protein
MERMRTRSATAIALLVAIAAVAHPAAGQPDEVAVNGVVVRPTQLMYPVIAASAFIEGPVVVSGLLDDSGVPSELVVVSGHKLLAEPSLASVKTWMFRRGAPGRFVVVLDFRLEGACHTGGRTQVTLSRPNMVRVTSCGIALW